MTHHKKLIEVALPLEAINKASAREKSIRHGHPSTLHLWWARRPLAAARAVIFAQMVDDPSAIPDLFPTEKAQERERQRLFKIIEELVLWENTTNEDLLQPARDEIWQSWRRACAQNADHPRAHELFDRHTLPAFHDPFAGGGALPLEAQRLGLEAHASDLNPVAVLISKAMIEIPPKFAGRPPVNPEGRSEGGGKRSEGRGERSESGGRCALSRDDSVAEGDGGGTRGLSPDTSVAQGRDLRDALTDYQGGRVDPCEHRRGVDTRDKQGQGSLPGDGPGIVGGDRDASDAVRGSGLVSSQRDTDAARALGRGESNVDNDASQKTPGLTSHSSLLFPRSYHGAAGLAEDVRYYGRWMRDEASRRIGHLYPKVEISAEMAKERPDLEPYLGRKLTVIAWLWARTVKSPDPAFGEIAVPLVSNFMLSTKKGKEAYVEPLIEGAGYRFAVRVGKPPDPEAAKKGTKLGRGANFRCLMSGTPIAGDYIKTEGRAGRMGARLMAIVAAGDRARVYLRPTDEMERIARQAQPKWRPETILPDDPRNFWTVQYGLTNFGDLFTPRQLVALTTFSDLVGEARELAQHDAMAAGLADDGVPLADVGNGARAYGEAVGVYLTFALSKLADRGSTICTWFTERDSTRNTFARQSIPMTWDFAELNTLLKGTGSFLGAIGWTAESLECVPPKLDTNVGKSDQSDASSLVLSNERIVSTDPPYYDNVGYADLSDFFYVWLRRSLKPVFPDLFATLAVPKAEELVATPYRHGGKEQAEAFFMDGMAKALRRLAEQSHPTFPVTIYYAFKQSEKKGDGGTASTGWETFLDAVIRAGFGISGTWPMRTELANRMIGKGTNALASSIVLVCRKRSADAPAATRRELLAALKAELPAALVHLQRSNIAPVDLAQAAIGPGMAVYTRFSRVLESDGSPLAVRTALTLINQVLDEVLAEQEGDLDADSRWALAWFEQYGFGEGEYGVAETLSKAKNTSVAGLVEGGILSSKSGKVRLLAPGELQDSWDPAKDKRITEWEMVHHLIHTLEAGGERAAAELLAKLRALGLSVETARDLAYRLYTVCERKKRAGEALAYNALVQSWTEITRLAREAGRPRQEQGAMFGNGSDEVDA